MKKIAFPFTAVCLLFSLVSCVSVDVTRLGVSPQRPVVPADQVIIYSTADKVPGKYEEIALLNAAASSTWTTESGMYEAMKKKAGQYGANAIILDAMSEPSAGAKIAGAIFGVSPERKGKAIAIYVFQQDN